MNPFKPFYQILESLYDNEISKKRGFNKLYLKIGLLKANT